MPALVGVNENLAFTRMVPASNEPSLAVTVWLEGPALVQVTVVPTVVLIVGGSKLKSTIRTWLVAAAAEAATAVPADSVDVANGVNTVEIGAAGPDEGAGLFGPGVLVEEMMMGLGVELAADGVLPPQAAALTTSKLNVKNRVLSARNLRIDAAGQKLGADCIPRRSGLLQRGLRLRHAGLAQGIGIVSLNSPRRSPPSRR